MSFIVASLVLVGLIVILNLLAFWPAFSDGYMVVIYPTISNGLGMVTDRISFPLGEVLMILAAVLLLLLPVFMALLLFLRKKAGYKAFALGYAKGMLVTFLLVVLVYTLNWMIPYRSSLLDGNLTPEEPNYVSLKLVREQLIHGMNKACREVRRDHSGNVIYPEKEEVQREIEMAMHSLVKEFPRLGGFYPKVKPAIFSDVLQWMSIGGYTYPYTMEVTYNRYLSRLYYPTLAAHEAVHHQGYYKENEANFLSFLACSRSEDALLRYSANIYMFYYIDDAYMSILQRSNVSDEILAAQYTDIEPQVWSDISVALEAAQKVYESTEHPLESFSDEAEYVAESGWETQARVIEGYSYNDVVKLMVAYFAPLEELIPVEETVAPAEVPVEVPEEKVSEEEVPAEEAPAEEE